MKITLNITPKATPRPRFSSRGHTYYPKDYVEYKHHIITRLRALKHQFVFTDPISIDMVFYMPIPKTYAKKIKEGDIHSKKPDCTNLAKGIEDMMNGIIYQDDSLIAKISIAKVYSNNPRIEIDINLI